MSMNEDRTKDRENSLWQRDQIEKLRIRKVPELEQIVVAIDPPITSGEKADLCGIVAAGIDKEGRGFVLKDQSTKSSTLLKWAQIAIELYHEMQADRIVAEVDQGGVLVEAILHRIDPTVPIKRVRTSRGKYTRAELVATLYEQGRISHVGCHSELEDQMCVFGPAGLPNGKSSDRLDTLVWALTDLMLNTKATPRIRRL